MRYAHMLAYVETNPWKASDHALKYRETISEDAEAFAKPGEFVTRGEYFHLEALRLRLLEERRTSLTNLQSLQLVVIHPNPPVNRSGI